MSAPDLRQLLEKARNERDDDRRWELLVAATAAGPAPVRAAAERLLSSGDDDELVLGADLISAMPHASSDEATAHFRVRGWPVSEVGAFSDEDRKAIAALLGLRLIAARDPDVVWACVIAAGKLARAELLDAVLQHVGDADDDVREGCARVLPSLDPGGPSTRAVAALVALARDPVPAVRDWALFGMGRGQGRPIDTPETRAVFRENVDDKQEDVRLEAIEALGLLGDVEMLAIALTCREPGEIGSEAIELAARLGDERLREPLVRLRERGWSEVADPALAQELDVLLSAAIAACAGAPGSRAELR